ncbi:hypothetical protein EYF80_030520 [Liparis tanakae]|uniref:Uncharacterized protein n=1 Tax=Liparis tanakae TaxID=230148 RepID=A0A4Z2H1M2_9TELE|nr:hypothetical protein EYF80_030520 [Liparis tanakae]
MSRAAAGGGSGERRRRRRSRRVGPRTRVSGDTERSEVRGRREFNEPEDESLLSNAQVLRAWPRAGGAGLMAQGSSGR